MQAFRKGMGSRMNQEKLRKMDVLLETEMKEERIKGASLLIEHKGKQVFRNVYGNDREDTIYKVFSMTKPITTTAAMLLYERGEIDLYDSVEKYLPGFRNMKVSTAKGLVDAKSPILLSQLLNMTSGLVYPGTASEPERVMEAIRIELHEKAVQGAGMSNLDIINALGGAPLLFHPGEGFRYGISADVVAGVIEVVTQMPYGDFLKKEIFEPLEMKDTDFFVPDEKMGRLAQVYSRVDEAGHLKEADEKTYEWMNMYAPNKPPYIQSGGGGLYSSLEDYRHFVQMLAGGGSYKGRRILGRKTIDFISTNQLNELQMSWVDFGGLEGYGYGNFMRVMMNPALGASNGSVGEYGWDGLPGTYFFVDPKEELLFVYMQQIEQGGDLSLRRKMRQIIYGALE